MVEHGSVPISAGTVPINDASEPPQNTTAAFGFMRPSFSYLNAINMPPGSSQQLSPNPVMQSESLGSSGSLPPMSSGLSTVEQGPSAVEKSASSPVQAMLPPASSLPSHPGPAVQAPHPGNYSFNGNMEPKQTDQSQRTHVRADGFQGMGAITSASSFTQSAPRPASQPGQPNSSPSATHFASNNYSNLATWTPPAPNYQAPIGKPNTPVTPGPPGIASSLPPPNSTIPSSLDSNVFPRTFMPAAPVLSNPSIQHHSVAMYPSPSPSPQTAPPGPWLHPQQISGFARPAFPPYAAVVPAPYPIPTRGTPPVSVSLPDIQPPGVSSAVSAVGATTTSVAAGGQLSMGSGQAELRPGVDNSKDVGKAESKHEASTKELDAWTAHRTETGIVYYYNALTGESTYEKPSGFKGESDKATVQPSPISWEKLNGTDWTLVTTNDGKRYYYNTRTQLSSWQIPSEVIELRKKQDADALKAQSVSVTNANIVAEKESDPASLSIAAANAGGRDITAVRSLSVSASPSALDLIKKKLQDSGNTDSTSPNPTLSGAVTVELNGSKPVEAPLKGIQNENNKDKRKDANGDGDMSNSSSDSDDEDGGPTKEECILQFKEMLKERGVAPFSKWEKELPKIVFDPRFKAMSSHSARRALFEHYVRTRAEEERKEKRAAQKAALEGFKQLLEEAKEDIDQNTDYQKFKRRWGEDPRFQALDRKEREFLLNERVFSLRRAAQEREQAERAAAISNFKSMLHEKGDFTSSSRWSKVKDSLKSDPRYKAVKHEDREKLFNEYIAELKAAEEETERKAKAKQDEEEKLKERERALRKRKEREEQEVERVRQKARRKEAVESYQALLVETIKDPQASWTESKAKLEKDPQGRAANPHLDKSDLEKLFREHVKSLYERCVVEFRSLLNEVITAEAAAPETEGCKTIITSWSTANQLLKNDPRYNKMPRKERESLWRRHAEEIQRKQKKVHDQQGEEKSGEGKGRSSVDPGKHSSGSRRAHDRR
ncbi:Transcription factor CA150 [Handroanthus impetiginosus]|uniref:Transcription factor CA150 n=1 Tax=Handroanthus impetiginosus TaxID=429701 RepID=A0A2G9H3J2_9LAMI|nr:Transcription factor CA150 [Handroanthus impetiginosus]